MLIAWNTWITSVGLFQHKLGGTPLASSYEALLASVFSTTNLATLALFLFAKQRFSVSFNNAAKVGFGLVANATVFAVAILVARTVADAYVFLDATLLLVAMSAVAGAMMASVLALVSSMNPIYVQAINVGQGVAGLVPSIVSLISHVSAPPPTRPFLVLEAREEVPPTFSSLVPFIVSIGLSVVSLVGLAYLPRHSSSLEGFSEIVDSDREDEELNAPSVDNSTQLKRILWDTKEYSFSIFWDFVVTLAVFPALTVSIQSVRQADPDASRIFKDLFTPIMFIVFNLGDLFGKFLPGLSAFLITSPQRLLRLSLARTLFVPLLLLCNMPLNSGGGSSLLPRVFGDAEFMFLVFTIGLTNGWVASNVFMVGPASAGAGTEGVAADGLVFWMTVGLAVGGGLSNFFV
ncbi:nucleoside transporter-domain-containing protein [Chytriomyces sp. MP71]|nr:nucleoside transporter-domain-containing protein [Chytriomyces sp. MP71]